MITRLSDEPIAVGACYNRYEGQFATNKETQVCLSNILKSERSAIMCKARV